MAPSQLPLPISFSPINTCCHAISSSTPPQPQSTRREGKEASSIPHSQSRALCSSHHETGGSDRAYSAMSRGSKGGRGVGLDLKLHLSPPARGTEGAAASLSSDEEWSSSSPSSCLSSEGEREPQQRSQRQQSHGGLLQWSDSPEATSMVLAACPRCLMYVMLSEADPRCPRCRSPVLLDFLHHAAARNNSGGGSSINVVSGPEDGDDHSRNSTRGGGGRNRRA